MDPRAAIIEWFATILLIPGFFVCLAIVGWWLSRINVRPGDELRRPERRAESVEGSE